jgi:iron complex transport system ATP-binding protein
MVKLVFDRVCVTLSPSQENRPALKDVTLSLKPGRLTALIGPNGAGKTTLMRLGVGLIAPQSGAVRLNGVDPRAMPAIERARLMGYLPQSRPLAWPLTVRDLIALGRYAFGAGAGRLSAPDAAAVDQALALCDLEAFADRRTDALSGGELARAHIARALAAQAPILLADEPAAALDPRHAEQTMSAIRRFARSGGAALVSVHDLNLAARYADELALLADGVLLVLGPPKDVLTPQRLAEVFGVDAAIDDDGALTIRGPA